MPQINISKRASKFLLSVPAKHSRQLAFKITELSKNPYPNDSKKLQGKFNKYHRITAGEYRIIYKCDKETIFIVLIGKRNDDDVYKMLVRLIQ